jgi:hypothetical protein
VRAQTARWRSARRRRRQSSLRGSSTTSGTRAEESQNLSAQPFAPRRGSARSVAPSPEDRE